MYQQMSTDATVELHYYPARISGRQTSLETPSTIRDSTSGDRTKSRCKGSVVAITGAERNSKDCVDSSNTNQIQPNHQNSTKPLVPREGGERSVRRCSAVDKMSDNESEDLPPPDKFGAFLKFGDEIAPVFDDLAIEQAERRKLDAVRIEKTIIVIDRLNVAVDAAIKERIESDQLIEKLNITRLDAMQRKLVHQIETGFQALQDELDEAKERLRIATEKLYQVWADSLRLVVTWRVRCASLPEPSAVR
jgi:hypothetical protein